MRRVFDQATKTNHSEHASQLKNLRAGQLTAQAPAAVNEHCKLVILTRLSCSVSNDQL